MARTGRPKKELNWSEIDKLLTIQCTDEEICGWFDIDINTLKACCKRDKKMTFSQYSGLKKGKGKISLRRTLWQRAHDPKNTAALIFACKTLLGLREHDGYGNRQVEAKVDGSATIVLKWVDEDNA